VQAVHSIIAASQCGLIPADAEHPHLVVLTVPSEDELGEMARTLVKAAVPHRCYYEADMDDRLTALATAPVTQAQRRWFRRWPLL
jgi:hypothetical protein